MSVLFPDVPNVPGVPPVLRKAGQFADEVQTLLTQDSSDAQSDSAPQWGIYDDGDQQVIVPDNIVSIEDRLEYQLSNYPIERGGFESYDKVAQPYQVHMVMTKSGTVDDRVAFLDACQKLAASTDLYTVLTPDQSFLNANIIGARKARSGQSGVQLIAVELLIEEVRVTATAKLSNTKSPASADATNNGSVQVVALSGQPVPPYPQ